MRECVAHDEFEGEFGGEVAELAEDAAFADADSAGEASILFDKLEEVCGDIFEHFFEGQVFIDHGHGIEEALASCGVHDEEGIDIAWAHAFCSHEDIHGAAEVDFDDEVFIEREGFDGFEEGIWDDAMFFVGLGVGRFELFVNPFAWCFFCAAEHAAVCDAKFFGELGIDFEA